MASPITSVTRDTIVVQPPTLVYCILPVRPSATAPGGWWTVTVADRQGVTMTVDLAASAVPTYECCHAALRRATGHPFRYLPVEPQTASTVVAQTRAYGGVYCKRSVWRHFPISKCRASSSMMTKPSMMRRGPGAMTPGYAAVRQPHPRVERKQADRVRYHDGRRSRYRGQWQVTVQYLLTGLAVNVKRMVTLLHPRGHSRSCSRCTPS
jgi:hypothetical protein